MRKVFQPKEPHVPLTKEECEALAIEGERYRDAIMKRLDRLDNITSDDLKIRVK
jgi:hypothetical protein